MVRCHEVGGSALMVWMLSGPRASSILVKGSANLLSFHITPYSISQVGGGDSCLPHNSVKLYIF